MRFSQFLFAIVFTLLLPSLTWAAVGVTSNEIQDTLDIILPSEKHLDKLQGYDAFRLLETERIEGGISAIYQAQKSSEAWVSSDLPQLKLVIYSYSSQDSAHNAFTELSAQIQVNTRKTVLTSDERWISFQSEEGYQADVFNSIRSDFKSLHRLHVNGNLLYQASLYNAPGIVLQETRGLEILENAIEASKLGLGILFPPVNTELSAKSEKSSLDLSSLYEIPLHGSAKLDIYIGEEGGALGTILDSSGIAKPVEGDIYLYLKNDATLQAGIYAPNLDTDCDKKSGWVHLSGSTALHEYEWNSIELHYGVGGFWIDLNGKEDAFCGVAQSRSDRPLYFGDFPEDGLEQSFIGHAQEVSFVSSLTTFGQNWDVVLSEQLFLDVASTDDDLEAFQFLKEKGIFVGSEGYLSPERILTRAEMTKILLKAFDYSVPESSETPFVDVLSTAWYRNYTSKAFDIEMITLAENAKFFPDRAINRAEFFTMVQRVDSREPLPETEPFSDVFKKDWYFKGALYASKFNLIFGDSFLPSEKLTRRDAAQILYQLLNE